MADTKATQSVPAPKDGEAARLASEDIGPPRIEATDYVNGGHPHTSSLLSALDSASPSRAVVIPPHRIGSSERPSTPRSVQFVRGENHADAQQGHVRHTSWDARDALGKIRNLSLVSKLKDLALPASPATRGTEVSSGRDSGSAPGSPVLPPQILRDAMEEGSDVDADAEETADETVLRDDSRAKKKRRRRRPKRDIQSTPDTPQLMPADSETGAGGTLGRLGFMRRSTMPDSSEARGGLSEGEGRDQLARGHRLGRGVSLVGSLAEDGDGGVGSSSRRTGHTRRISVFGGGGVSDGDAMSPKRPLFPAERASNYGVQKWRQVKSTLKALRQKKDNQFDLHKSTELMAELRAGAPAVLMFASMIQRDEHGNKRIPVLLEQVKLRLTDSTPVQAGDSERHWLFTIELEYGSGPSRMRWTIKRTIREILNLHWKYKLALRNEKFPTAQLNLGARPKQPKFPLSSFPYLRGVRGLDEAEEDDTADMRGGDEQFGDGVVGDGTAAEATATDNEDRVQQKRKTSRINVLGGRRKLSSLADANGSRADVDQADTAAARRRYVERQRKVLEKYLQEMVRWLIFRADSNRLCRFLELSALGIRLAAEGSYHGKECYLHIQSSKGLDFRRVLTPTKVIARHTRKWFLVRQSYIVCVESPENMNIYDVYLVDPKFKIICKKGKGTRRGASEAEDMENIDLTASPPAERHHTLKLLTSERKIKLFSRNQHLIQQFEDSITEMLRQTPWHLRNRFGSFAPVRTGVHAQWLIDGRDYMWNASRAINMAKDVIYIHDWWLSPELYMRRPACISQKWRLDRLLQRKAKEGVKIFVIVYRNVEAAVPIDSEHTKMSLLNLHPNVFVQRSPNQFKKNQYFFAHHEKICIVDHDVAFLGGIDLCFGRWDCPQHPVADDKPTGFEPQDNPKDAEHCQLFPGKDYSNPRVQDFFRLTEPYEEMYDRGRVPRMPWHDVGMQLVGQPVRDLTRHFVQRWNYLRRGRKPTRPIPFLLPPPDCNKEDLDALGLTGTCEVQILRSASSWSLGVHDTECSIQAAYVKMIEESEHFIYIENQFFITSTETMNTKIANRIGDALVERILRAHDKDEDWRAVILIPLMPGFQNEVNEQDGTSVRLILQCQFRSICRGEQSIFGRLRAAGVDPEDYIQFFSLRQWGKLGHGLLTTEQLYIHAKTIIVDDRIALIGSANINERSMLGVRDSEVAAIIRDTDMLWSTMAGRPYRVGRFAHTMRMRLMREHLGLDVDEIMEEERGAEFDVGTDRIHRDDGMHEMDDLSEVDETDQHHLQPPGAFSPPSLPRLGRGSSINHDVPDLEQSGISPKGKESQKVDTKAQVDIEKQERELDGLGPDPWKLAQQDGIDEGRDSVIVNGREVLVHNISAEGRGTLDSPKVQGAEDVARETGGSPLPPMPPMDRRTTEQLGLLRANQLPSLPLVDDTDIGGPPVHVHVTGRVYQGDLQPGLVDIKPADVHKDCMKDPLDTAFYDDVWSRVAENNTKIFRRVFRVMPDSEATNWAEYKEFKAYNERFKASMDGQSSSQDAEQARESTASTRTSPNLKAKMSVNERPRASTPNALPSKAEPVADAEKVALAMDGSPFSGSHDMELPNLALDSSKAEEGKLDGGEKPTASLSMASSAQTPTANATSNEASSNGKHPKRRRRATTRGSRRGLNPADDLLSRAEAEEVLNTTQGTLVQFPYDWLVVEEANGNWLFQVDQVAPLQIYI